VGAEARMGDAIFGRATVESTRPACAGTAAATLRNMMDVDVCGVFRYSVLLSQGFDGICEFGRRWCRWEGGCGSDDVEQT
jgi:hypothetical protein